MSALILNNYRAELITYVRRRVSDKDAVEDLVQETFLSALCWLERGNVPEKPLPLLYTIARNVILRDYRDNRVHHASDCPEHIETVTPEVPSAEQQTISDRELEQLCKAMDALPRKCRQVFILRKVYQYSYNEIAEHMGISEYCKDLPQEGLGTRA